MSRSLAPCIACGRHVRTAELKCPFCRTPRSPLLAAAVLSIASCGTPAQPVTAPRELPAQIADAATPDTAAPIAPDAASMVDLTPVKGKASIRGRVFRSHPQGTIYHEIGLSLVSPDRSVMLYVATSAALQGTFDFKDVPAGTYKLYIADNTNDGDGELEVVVKSDEILKLDIDLNQVLLRRRPPKPYGAPPARRRVV